MKVLLRTTEYSDDTQGASTSSTDFGFPRPNAGEDEGLRSLHGARGRARGRMLPSAAPEPSSGTGFPELVHPRGIPLTPNPSPALGRGEPILTTTTASEQIAQGCRRSQVGERVYGATFAVGGALPLFAALLSLACPLSLWAQGADRVTIPFSDAVRPRLVKVSLLSGGIIVRGYEGKDVLVDAQNKDGKSEAMPKRAQGMKRIKPAGSGLIAEEENNIVTVSTGLSERSVDLLVQVPVNTSLKLNAIDDGDILVENVEGEIEVNNVDGDVKLNKVSGTVVAHTVDGDLTVSIMKVNPGKAMSFSSLDGDIDVTFPADFKASVKVHSNNGEIYSDFDIQPAAATRAPAVKDERAKGGKFSVQIDKGVVGNINGGGQEVQFKTFDGDIYIRRAGK